MRGLRLHEARRARGLRQDQTEAERKLWRRLRNRTLGGFKFVRQEPIVPYFADFVCRDEKLIVEVDGATHSTDDERRRGHRDKAENSLLRAKKFFLPASGEKGSAGPQSQRLAFSGKPGRWTLTTQKRWPVGACITTQRSRRSTTVAPSFPRRSTSAGIGRARSNRV